MPIHWYTRCKVFAVKPRSTSLGCRIRYKSKTSAQHPKPTTNDARWSGSDKLPEDGKLWAKLVYDLQRACEREKVERHRHDQAEFLKEKQNMINQLHEQKENYKYLEQRLNNEIARLVQENRALKAARDKIDDKFKKYHQNFEIRGALEHIIQEAETQEKILPNKTKQTSLNLLAEHADIMAILLPECKARSLDPARVKGQIWFLYAMYSAYAHGHDNDLLITVDHPPFRRAALVVLLKLQDNWNHPVKWSEEKISPPMPPSHQQMLQENQN
ncbi:hypothetical protein B9Z19DRAFT_1136435 [Tuber borchii]|uniref:Uncharacterized protein n=1 Tax=Tuber borchii TaxID=42251 RepID=A0A2T6ZBL1_TUBBO|nr:hypothetical protein B9Z19DRAFT_1136435 [Tuber borchii]